jgi:spore coat protein U-like protein
MLNPTELINDWLTIRPSAHVSVVKMRLSAVHTQHRCRNWKLAIACFFILILGGLPRPAAAAFSCTISFTNINFGSFDVVTAGTIEVTGTGTINCTGAAANNEYVMCINIYSGANVSGTQRRMLSGSNYLSFGLYGNNSYFTSTGSWPQSFGVGYQVYETANSSGNIVNQTITIYGQVLSGQTTVNPGSYSETMGGVGIYTDIQYGSLDNGPSCPTGSSTSNASFTVTATVIPACTVSATTLDFGSTSSLASAVNSTATITAKCDNTLAYSIGLDNGQNAIASQRYLSAGTGTNIKYNLYTNSGYSDAWTTTTANTSCTGGSSTCALGTGTGSNQNYTVYGQVPAQTKPGSGTYTDTVVVTVTY